MRDLNSNSPVCSKRCRQGCPGSSAGDAACVHLSASTTSRHCRTEQPFICSNCTYDPAGITTAEGENRMSPIHTLSTRGAAAVTATAAPAAAAVLDEGVAHLVATPVSASKASSSSSPLPPSSPPPSPLLSPPLPLPLPRPQPSPPPSPFAPLGVVIASTLLLGVGMGLSDSFPDRPPIPTVRSSSSVSSPSTDTSTEISVDSISSRSTTSSHTGGANRAGDSAGDSTISICVQ
mmetsp:Transcript_21493/g.53166  ORF Transcript_21493/g.53166 Transcript_21493/m.53166 type:complete len:234 (+) Transcript_21493:194-895(+)